MEITNETKAKLFALYLGQRVELYNGGSKVRNKILCAVGGINDGIDYEYVKLRMGNIVNAVFIRENRVKLILKPYYFLSGEDAKTVLQMKNKYPIDLTGGTEEKHLKRCIDLVLNFEVLDIRSYQFLISKGYDLNQYLLDGSNLHEAGLAVYENE